MKSAPYPGFFIFQRYNEYRRRVFMSKNLYYEFQKTNGKEQPKRCL